MNLNLNETPNNETDLEQYLIKETITKLFGSDSFTFSYIPTMGGVNNITKYITINNQTYVIRIYNNGNNLDKVILEHEVLYQLSNMSLSFQTPSPLFKDKPYVTLSNNSHATIFKLIPGSLAKLTNPYLIGKASGELSEALSKVKFEEKFTFPTPPYYDIYKAHESITRENFFNYIKNNEEIKKVQDSIDFLTNQILSLESLISDLLSLNMPVQLIHGDLHYDNILVNQDQVSGVLDFEFCSMDWRIMELAICLSKYASEGDRALGIFDDFIRGYFESYTKKLCKEEVEAVPKLIILRILSNTVYFVGRAIAKEDSIDALTERAEAYANRIKWLIKNDSTIVNMVKFYVKI